MANMIKMYVTQVCPYCQMAVNLLKTKGITLEQIEKIYIDQQPEMRELMMEITGRRTVPQIFIGAQHVGGFDDLKALDQAGGLDPLLAAIGSN